MYKLLEFGLVDSLPEAVEVFFAAAEALNAESLVQRLPHSAVLGLDQFQLRFKGVTEKIINFIFLADNDCVWA